ncbi:MAG: outer membrane protein assembly factor BamA, partial [Nitrospirae bacterium]
MKNRGIRLFFVFLICLAIMIPAKVTAQEEAAPLVTAIEVQGVKRIEPGAIRQKISQKVGEPLSGEKIASDIKKIYEMGYFDDVKAETEFFEGGIKVIFIVKEKPTIVKVDFEGNKEFDDEKLKEKITIVPGAIADVTLIQDNVAALRSFYESEGYWRVKIVPVVRRITENESSLTFMIEEGRKVRIRDIIIEGNSAISDRKIKKVMKTKEWWIFSFITKSGYYEKGQMRLDLESIRELYLDNGYLEVKVAEPVVKPTEDGKKLDIIIKVSEGPQYKVGDITFRGHRAADEKKLRELIGIKKGDIFSKGKLSEGIKKATEFYSEKGYAMASIEPGITTDEKAHTASITMNISEGDIFYIGRIEVIGNTKTL